MPDQLAREIARTMAEAETIIRRQGGLLDRNAVAMIGLTFDKGHRHD